MSALSEHFEVSQEREAYLYEWLACQAFGNGAEFALFSPSRDVEALTRLRKAIIELDRAKNAMTGAAGDALSWPNPDGENPLGEWLLQLSQHRDEFLSKTQEVIDEVKLSNAPKGRERINMDAISLVDAARVLWKSEKGQDAPNGADINDASEFSIFLTDLLEDFGISGAKDGTEANARSAYRAWAKHLGQIHT